MKRSLLIAEMTLRELLRDKILYSSLFLGGLLLILSFMMANLSFFKPVRVLLDVGLSGTQISTALIAILASGATLNREFERRTVYMVLSRPVSNWEFLCGKWLGVCAIIALNLSLLAAVHVLCLHLFAVGGITELPSVQLGLLGLAWIATLVFGGLLSGLSLLIASASSTAVTFMIGIGIYLIGTNISAAHLLVERQDGPLRQILEMVLRVFPNLESLHLNILVSRGLVPQTHEIIFAAIHAAGWVIFAIWIASHLLKRKETGH